MITIQGFARLCGCKTQTLRYYDQIGLLKPAKVDEWTGYRYYEEEQAMIYVKIRNLQQADFSIEEIKTILPGDDDLLMTAFAGKIREQEQKLERIRTIQKSYLSEKMEMQNTVNMLMNFVEGRMGNPVLWNELGLDIGKETEISARVHETLADWLAECRNASAEIASQMSSQDMETMKTVMDQLSGGNPDGKDLIFAVSGEEGQPEESIPEDAQTVFERDGWEHVSDWIGDLQVPDCGKENYFMFRVREDSPVSDPGFPTLMLAVMDARYHIIGGGMNCRISLSNDGLNHFALLQK